MTSEVLQFWLEGKVAPKARPRVSNKVAYLPCSYRKWRSNAHLQLIAQRQEKSGIVLPIKRASIEVRLIGKHRGDVDNLLGAIADALVAAGILLDDRISCVPEMIVRHVESKKLLGAEITLRRLDSPLVLD